MEPWEIYAAQSQQSSLPTGQEPWDIYAQTAQQPAAQPNIIDNIGTDLSNRAQNISGLSNAYDAGNKNLPEATYETMGQLGSGLGDIAGEGVKSWVGMMPNSENVIPAAKQEFASSGVGKTLAAAMGEYQQIPQRVRDMIDATGGIAQAIGAYGPLKSAASGAADVADSALEGALPGSAEKFTPDAKFAITQDQARNLGGQVFQQAKQTGAVLGPQFTDGKLIPAANAMLPQTEAGQIMQGDSPFAKFVQNKIQPLSGKPLDFQSIQDIDEGLSDAIDEHTENGLPKKAAYPFMQLQGQIRQMVKPGVVSAADLTNGTPEAYDLWNKGQGIWSDSYKLGDLERIEQRAAFSQTPSQARQNGFKTLALNRAKMNIYNPDEQALINQSAQGSTTNDLLRLVGSRLGSVAAFGAAGGGVPGAIAGAAVYPVSKGARALADAMQARPGAKLAGSISDNILNKFPDYSPPSSPSAPLQITGPGATMYGDSMGNVGRSPNLAQEIISPQAPRPIVGDMSPSHQAAPEPQQMLRLPAPGRATLSNDEIAQMRAQIQQPPAPPAPINISPQRLLPSPEIIPPLPAQANARSAAISAAMGNEGALPADTIPVYPRSKTMPGQPGNMGAKTLGQIKALAIQGRTPAEIADYLKRMGK